MTAQDKATHGMHTMAFDIITVPSRCHRYTGVWTPEPDSPAGQRAVLTKVPPRNYAPMHWEGAPCSSVRGVNSWKFTDRVLDGLAFNALPVDEQCKTCLRHFLQA